MLEQFWSWLSFVYVPSSDIQLHYYFMWTTNDTRMLEHELWYDVLIKKVLSCTSVLHVTGIYLQNNLCKGFIYNTEDTQEAYLDFKIAVIKDRLIYLVHLSLQPGLARLL